MYTGNTFTWSKRVTVLGAVLPDGIPGTLLTASLDESFSSPKQRWSVLALLQTGVRVCVCVCACVCVCVCVCVFVRFGGSKLNKKGLGLWQVPVNCYT